MEEYQATPIKEVKTENELKRTMGFFTALSTVMGTVIGAGVFFKAASVAEVTGTVSLHMFSWFLGGVISVCAGLTGAELAAAIPETGGMIKYIERIYGNTAAFLLGWAQVVIYFPANVAALSIIFGTQFVNLFDLSQSMIVPVAVTAAVSIMLINFLGSKAGGAFSVDYACLQTHSFVCDRYFRFIPTRRSRLPTVSDPSRRKPFIFLCFGSWLTSNDVRIRRLDTRRKYFGRIEKAGERFAKSHFFRNHRNHDRLFISKCGVLKNRIYRRSRRKQQCGK